MVSVSAIGDAMNITFKSGTFRLTFTWDGGLIYKANNGHLVSRTWEWGPADPSRHEFESHLRFLFRLGLKWRVVEESN